MPTSPHPQGAHKQKMLGRKKMKIKSDCIWCLSVRSVTLVIDYRSPTTKNAEGRCSECNGLSRVMAHPVEVVGAPTAKVSESQG